jgi:hypothetical protein
MLPGHSSPQRIPAAKQGLDWRSSPQPWWRLMLTQPDTWILAVREKPEPSEPIIGTVVLEGREHTIQALLEWNGTQWWVRDEQHAYDHEVIHWMYLPEPPEPDQEYGR